jgi:nucleotide-binding universal stress UspA family protein
MSDTKDPTPAKQTGHVPEAIQPRQADADAEQAGAVEAGTHPIETTAKKKPVSSRKAPIVHVVEDNDSLGKLAKASRKKSGGKIILVPVDFSPHSEAALELAAELAEKIPAALMVLHVVHDPGEMPGYYSKLVKKKRIGRIQDVAKEVFDEFLHRFIEDHPDLKPVRKTDSLMVIGLPVTRILQVVEKVDPFMVVMGSQGRTGLKHLFLGSKAEQLVQLSPVPVTIVKKRK